MKKNRNQNKIKFKEMVKKVVLEASDSDSFEQSDGSEAP